MGFWKKLFGLEKKVVPLDLKAKDGDKDGKVQEGTIWERPADFKVNSAEDVAKLLEGAKKAPAKKTPAKKPAAKKADAPKKAPAKKPAAKTTKKTGTGGGGKNTKQAR